MESHATKGRMGTAASRPQLQRQLPLPVKCEKYPHPILLVDWYPIVGWFIIPINQPNQSTKLPVAEPRSHCCLLPPGMLRHRTSSKRHPSHLLEEGPRRCHLRIPSGYLTVCHGKYDRFYTVNHLSPINIINGRCSIAMLNYRKVPWMHDWPWWLQGTKWPRKDMKAANSSWVTCFCSQGSLWGRWVVHIWNLIWPKESRDHWRIKVPSFHDQTDALASLTWKAVQLEFVVGSPSPAAEGITKATPSK